MFDRRSKIVCTIGPASDSKERLERLIRAGMDVARLNFSHGSHAEHAKRLETLREVATACKKPVAALQDLCGPKIRAGSFPRGAYVLPPKGEVALVETKSKAPVEEEDTIPIIYEGLAEDVQPGDAILIDDGRVALRVKRVDGGRVLCDIIQTGTVRDQAGVHLPSRSVRISTLTEKDKEDLNFGLSLGIDYVALSFVRKADDIRLVREICEAWGRPTPIVAKIETPAAVEDLEGIIASADAIMVARGDLGVEFPPERVPVIQKQIIGLSRVYQKPVIVATEMLQSMVHATRPTRAEASDVANAVFDGTDAVMLSAESATGDHPDLAASMMARIITEAESSPFYTPLSSLAGDAVTVPEAIARAACAVAREIKACVLVAFTETGSTARFVSKARPKVPIIAFSPNETTRRRLGLYWGVSSQPLEKLHDADAMVERANAFVLSSGLGSPGDKMVAVFGAPVGVSGTTNSIRVRILE
ncbi:MAG TPA: pyruvate kinase [Polyangiaceae bacterium]|nr:pyruvate kinase [Polyangiaceae bacterium]